MKFIRTLFTSVFLFSLAYAIGFFFSLKQFPKNEFTRITQDVINIKGDSWIFFHTKNIITPDFKEIVKPARDFLYSTATLEAIKGPHVISIPAMDRYYVLQFMENDTDVFAYIGSRTHGKNKPQNVLLVPNGYDGPTYDLETIQLKTDMVWALARYQVFNDADVKNVHDIQKEVKFTPLKDWVE